MVYPSVTPVTRLATSVRDNPCSERLRRSSSGLATTMAPSSSRDTLIGSATASSRVPLGPLTDTFWPSIDTSTPAGTGTGCFPIRDIASSPSPHVCEDFAAHALSGSLAVGPQTRRRGNDRHAQTAEHARQIGGSRVDTQTGLGHPAQACDAALTARSVLQLHHKRLAHPSILGVVIGDVTLRLEDLGDVGLDLRVRQGHLVVIRRIGVAQTCQEVCDRVRHGHDSRFTFLAAVPNVPIVGRGPTATCLVSSSLLVGSSRKRSSPLLPAGLLDTGQLAGVRHLTKADPAEPELAVHRVRAATPVAAGVAAHLELGLLVGLVDQSLLCHLLSSP